MKGKITVRGLTVRFPVDSDLQVAEGATDLLQGGPNGRHLARL
jgi:hypothetical protein